MLYDAIVIGARCGGAPTAMLLARAGHRVLLVDRDHFPSDAISTHFIWPRGVAHLAAWGLVDRVLETNCAPVPGSITSYDGKPVGREEFADRAGNAAFGLAPRRYLLDQILVDAAIEAGAEFRQGVSVTSVLRDDAGRVTGIEGRANGAPVAEEARVVIGADGIHSRIARLVEAEEYDGADTIVAIYYSYWSGVEGIGRLELNGSASGAAGFIGMPTNDGQLCLGGGFPIQRLREVREDIEGYFTRALERVAPPLAERVAGGKREAPFRGMASLPHFVRKPYGAGWALVGDAGYHLDPTLGFGISNTFYQVQLLTDALHETLTGARDFDEAMAEYQVTRDRHLQPYYERNIATSRSVAGVEQPVS